MSPTSHPPPATSAAPALDAPTRRHTPFPTVPRLRSPSMLRFLGSPQGFCDGVNRRNFLQIGAFGAGLTLADMLRAKAAGTATKQGTRSQKAAIMIYLP